MVQVNNGTNGEFLIAANTGYTARRFYIGVGYWDDASPGGTKNLYSAWFSKTRQVAVGEGGFIYRRAYQGISWQGWAMETSNLTTDLRSVWGASETNIFTVGLNGKILFWDGSNWTPPPPPPPTSTACGAPAAPTLTPSAPSTPSSTTFPNVPDSVHYALYREGSAASSPPAQQDGRVRGAGHRGSACRGAGRRAEW